MDQDCPDNESLIARVQELERERNELHKDIEQLCMQQAGPAYIGVATRMHFQRTTALEQDIESLQKKLAACTRENQNLKEELSEAYRIKGQLAELHTAEVSKNVEAEKQLKFFQGCVAAAFAERDNAMMEAEKAKEKVEIMPKELEKSQRRVEELTNELLEEKGLAMTLQVVDKFYNIRQCSVENCSETSWEEKCECLLSDSAESWRFQDDEDTSTSNYINSLETEIETLRRSVDNMQNKFRVGLEIETHLKKKVCELEKKKFLSEEKIKRQISELLHQHSQYRNDITSLLDEGYSELKSINDVLVEKIRQLEQNRESNLESSLVQEKDLQETECRDVPISADADPASITKSDHPGLSTSSASETGETSEALALALQEKVSTLLLLSQQEERHLLERNVNAALQKKIEELQRNLLQVTNEKVKALMELAQLKQERYISKEKTRLERTQGKPSGEIAEQRIVQDKDGKFKNLLKRSYLTRWVGGSDGGDADANLQYERPNSDMDIARMKIENATLKESLESMEHLLSSVRRLRISLLKVKDSAVKSENSCWFDDLDRIIAEANLVKTALCSCLPISWSAAESEIDVGDDYEKLDFVSAAGFEMVELLIFASQVLKEQISCNDIDNQKNEENAK